VSAEELISIQTPALIEELARRSHGMVLVMLVPTEGQPLIQTTYDRTVGNPYLLVGLLKHAELKVTMEFHRGTGGQLL
jgi:hypothetical protein